MNDTERLKYSSTVLTAHMLAHTTINLAKKLEGIIGPNEYSAEARSEAENVLNVLREDCQPPKVTEEFKARLDGWVRQALGDAPVSN